MRVRRGYGLDMAILAAVLLASSLCPAPVVAAEGEIGKDAITASTSSKLDTGDNGWMLVSSALVLLMTAPGLAMFYGGLVRKKNVLGIMMQCMFLMCLMSVMWALWGYTLCFGGDGLASPPRWLGNVDHLMMRGVEARWEDNASVTPMHPALTIPRLTHMLFQGMFFIITPALICGAFAERMKFSAMVAFSLLWGALVYCPLCHAVWGGGVLQYMPGGNANASLLGGGALDFAGGTVVHISSGVSALVCALVLGKRLGYGSEPMPPHNMTYTAIGAAMLWVGWFGFNAGSALAANGLAASAFCATHLAAAAGGLTWAAIEWISRGKPSVLGACSGIVAGLVCITPAAGFVAPMPALAIGVAAGIVCYLACTSLKQWWKYDDALDAFGIHGVGGTLGALLTGVFATRATGAFADGRPLGLLEGGSVLTAQVFAVLITWALAIVATYVILKLLDAVMGLRVSPAGEIEGLDFSQHGEEGYIFI
jgi:Amt family ammonium transporter